MSFSEEFVSQGHSLHIHIVAWQTDRSTGDVTDVEEATSKSDRTLISWPSHDPLTSPP